MGRYLAAGIAVQVVITKRKDLWNNSTATIKDYKEKLVNQVGQFLDLSHFDIVEYDDSLIFNMDVDYFNNNIHDDYIKFKNVLNLSSDSYKLDEDYKFEDVDKEKIFNKNDYPVMLSLDEKMDYSFYINGSDYNQIDTQAFAGNIWLFYDFDNKAHNYDLFHKFKIYIYYVCIYSDIEKIDEEDDRNILTALNLLCNQVFKDGLTRDISFYISG